MKQLFFERDDKLGRLEYAEFLKTIILNSDQYKRDLLTNAYTIAVDSPWGTGKSYFFNMFMNYCRGYEGQNYSRDGELNSMKIVYYNAWENDFWDNPFEPIMNIILEEGLFDEQMIIENDEAAVNSFVSVVKKVGYGFAKTQVKKYCGEEVADIVQGGAASLKKHLFVENNLFKEFRDFRDSITNLKQMLSKYISYSDKKLVVIVDELDRCKPLFAIQTLEIVKHLFDVEDMVFVFAVDISQLSCSIKTVYGQDMDSTGYLCRFFDYISKIPQTSYDLFIKDQLNNITWIQKMENKEAFIKDISEFIIKIQSFFNLTLRDLDTILKSYSIMCDLFLKKYVLSLAHFNYLYFVTMKYKEIEMYNSIFSQRNQNVQEDVVTRINKEITNYSGIENSIKGRNKLILDLELRQSNYKGVPYDENFKVLSVDNNMIFRDDHLNPLKMEQDICLSAILFKPDLVNYENIKGLTYGDYIYQKLEMFNFVNMEI